MLKFQGQLTDQFGGNKHSTHWYNTEQEAVKKADRLAIKYGKRSNNVRVVRKDIVGKK